MGLVTDSAYEELQIGGLGPATFELLRRLVYQVRRGTGFPPPRDTRCGAMTRLTT
ncbi:hypothetical protein Sfulv_61530 [Streptomyces fulvorobeus]|uniref:Uncharacterized protein n=1 Tax=Streptomyces fulvorobeus TaxID=284028 RepID=A0A7J0CFQ9_9ACTN|nr:hypothetical protein Sfulv_61530 [Streptomyces fulvorobeus]